MKLWSGRSDGSTDSLMALLNDSLPVDRRMAAEDVRGSMAWVAALEKAAILTAPKAKSLTKGLASILTEFENAAFVFTEGDEDIHTAVERRLTEMCGPVGGKLHTGRSRNDQVATDFRLWVAGAADALEVEVKSLQAALLSRADGDINIVLPGYTHLQTGSACSAQPLVDGAFLGAGAGPSEIAGRKGFRSTLDAAGQRGAGGNSLSHRPLSAGERTRFCRTFPQQPGCGI